jgi:CO/xanthine dehydrogenase FAD-binding subunit
MLLNLREYHRPDNLEEAVTLLRRRTPITVPLGGGTYLVASGRRDVEAVVDLRDVALSYVRAADATLHIGATTPLQQIIDSPEMRSFSSGVLADTARAGASRNIRVARTIGGLIASAGGEDPLLAALLALDAKLTLLAPKARQIPLVSFLAYRERLLADGALITALRLPLLVGPLGGAYAAVGRTPYDRPIVCAVARLELAQGIAANVRLALGGVAPLPVRANELEQTLERKPLLMARIEAAVESMAAGLEPLGDFRGSAGYRRAMARVLARRALSEAMARAQAMGEQDDELKAAHEASDEGLSNNQRPG